MKAIEVNCITLCGRLPHHELITHLGHIETQWRIEMDHAVRCLELNIERYYVVDVMRPRWVFLEVFRMPGQAPYLRARTAPGHWSNHLLSLPRCRGHGSALLRPPQLYCSCPRR